MKNQIPKHLCIALYFNIHLPRYKNLFKLTHIHIKKDEKLIFSYTCFFFFVCFFCIILWTTDVFLKSYLSQ